MTAENQLRAYCQRNAGDAAALTVFLTFAWSLPAMSTYTKVETFDRWKHLTRKVSLWNLESRFGLSSGQAEPKWDELVAALPEAFLQDATYYEDKALIRGMTSSVLADIQRLSPRDWPDPSRLPATDSQVIGLFVHSRPGSEVTESEADPDPFNYGLCVRPEDFEKLTRQFIVPEGYREYRMPEPKRRALALLPERVLQRWDIGDVIVRLGHGYWLASVGASGNAAVVLHVPLPLVEDLRRHSDVYRPPEKCDKWAVKPDPFPDEEERKRQIAGDPERVEPGFRLVRVEHQIDVGRVDLLGEGRDGATVVVELKAGRISPDAVGQIQMYLVSVGRTPGGPPVRGIILGDYWDEAAQTATKGSRFRIDLRTYSELGLN